MHTSDSGLLSNGFEPRLWEDSHTGRWGGLRHFESWEVLQVTLRPIVKLVCLVPVLKVLAERSLAATASSQGKDHPERARNRFDCSSVLRVTLIEYLITLKSMPTILPL